MAEDAREPPEACAGWWSSRAASTRLGLSGEQVRYLVRQGRLVGRLVAGRMLLDPVSVETLATERERWISTVTAGKLAGCSASVVADAAQRGEILQRHVDRSLPSVDRASVLAWAEQRRVVLAEREQRRRHLEEQRALQGRPDHEHRWLTHHEAGEVLGVTGRRVSMLAAEDRLPYTIAGGRRWFRADHVHRWVRARALEDRFLATPGK